MPQQPSLPGSGEATNLNDITQGGVYYYGADAAMAPEPAAGIIEHLHVPTFLGAVSGVSVAKSGVIQTARTILADNIFNYRSFIRYKVDGGDYSAWIESKRIGADFAGTVPFPAAGTKESELHGFGHAPSHVWAQTICIQANNGYAIGDAVELSTDHRTATEGAVIYSTAVDIVFEVHSAGLRILGKGNATSFDIASAENRSSWRLSLLANR